MGRAPPSLHEGQVGGGTSEGGANGGRLWEEEWGICGDQVSVPQRTHIRARCPGAAPASPRTHARERVPFGGTGRRCRALGSCRSRSRKGVGALKVVLPHGIDFSLVLVGGVDRSPLIYVRLKNKLANAMFKITGLQWQELGIESRLLDTL